VRAYQHLKADNDPNGNAQRLYVVYELREDETLRRMGETPHQWWEIVEVYSEGYNLPAELRGMPELPSVRISKSDYHMRYDMAKGAGLLRYGS